MAAFGAAWQAVVFGAAGLWSQNGALTLRPMLPPSIHRIRMKVRASWESDISWMLRVKRMRLRRRVKMYLPKKHKSENGLRRFFSRRP